MVVLALVALLTAGPEDVPRSRGLGSGTTSMSENDPAGSLEIDIALQGELRPGRSAPLAVTLTNRSAQDVLVEDLIVSIEDITAPLRTDTLPCSSADFVVTQTTVQLLIPSGGTSSLPGPDGAGVPGVEMIDSNQDQGGCKDATLVLAARATGEQAS